MRRRKIRSGLVINDAYPTLYSVRDNLSQTEDSKGLSKPQSDACAGGDIAGGARKKLEERLGKSVVSKRNYLKKAEGGRLK